MTTFSLARHHRNIVELPKISAVVLPRPNTKFSGIMMHAITTFLGFRLDLATVVIQMYRIDINKYKLIAIDIPG